MSFTVKIKKSAAKDIRKLGAADQKKLRRSFNRYKSSPPITNVDTIKSLKSTYRNRIGKIRIIYTVSHNQKIIWIHKVNYRKDVYKRL